MAFNALVRSGLSVLAHPEDEKRRILIPFKTSLSEPGHKLEYCIVSKKTNFGPRGIVRWLGSSDLSIQQLTTCAKEGPLPSEILHLLQEQDQTMSQKEIIAALPQHKEKAVHTAIDRMGKKGDLISLARGQWSLSSTQNKITS